jgi:hypothetical protein
MSDLGYDLDPWAQTKPLESVTVDGIEVKLGDRVRLKPAGSADIFDLALKDRIAVVDGLEQDFEDAIHVAVVLEDDPGRDLGELRQPGHRFFFKPSEVELL